MFKTIQLLSDYLVLLDHILKTCFDGSKPFLLQKELITTLEHVCELSGTNSHNLFDLIGQILKRLKHTD